MKRRAGDPKIAIGYMRASTDEQTLSASAQRTTIEAWAARQGVSVVAWHVDQGVSGGSDLEDRPALLVAIAALRAHGAGGLVVARRDRLARDVGVALAIERETDRSGARVVCADGSGNGDGPSDVLLRRIQDAVAEHERALIGLRTRHALAVKRSRGEMTGAPPFGYRLADDGVHITPDAREQAVVARVAELRTAGASLRGIVASLAAAGVVGRAGKPLARTSIENILRRSLALSAQH